MEIIHEPYGIDDPYISIPGIERYPRDPLAGEKVIINFQTNPLVGQRSWVEYKINGNFMTTRSQFQNNLNGKAFWHGELPPTRCGEKVEYRIRLGTGQKNSFVTKWFDYTTKEWRKNSNFNKILINGNRKNKLFGSEILTDGDYTYNLKIFFKRDLDEIFFGLGEHYDDIEIPEGTRYVHVFDQYKVQEKRGYAPVPFIFSNKGCGIFLDTGFRSKWNFSKEHIEIEVETLGSTICNNIPIYVWENKNIKELISYMYKNSQPKIPPMWVFGPWMSANEWNSQKKVEHALEKAIKYEIPATVLVIEAWSDEQTFYIFNGAEYKEKENGKELHLEDFKFNEPWPNPKKMIKALNEKNIRLVLWQIPVLKYYEQFEKQHKKDVDYALKNDYILKEKDGSPYQIPEGRWFEKSYVVDFFNEEASKWWAKKRKYLVEELGVMGFKTDGGEHLWSRDLISKNKELENTQLRNLYPEKYFETVKSIQKEDNILFSRSGYIHSPHNTLFWVGDEDSEYEALKSNIIAGLNVSISGNPFWGWDIAGFSGDLPEIDLYKRSCELAIFTPIFQFHSEHSGDPIPSAERSPWNMAEYYNDYTILDFYKFCASLRMNLSPYIFQEATFCVENNLPLTLPLWVEEPEFYNKELAYYFGRDILVFPKINNENNENKIRLPKGSWLSLWDGKWFDSEGQSITYKSSFHHPVFLKKGAIIPLSIGEAGKLGVPHWSQDFNAILIVNNNLEEINIQNSSIKNYSVLIEKIKKEFNKEITKVGIPMNDKEGIINIKWINNFL